MKACPASQIASSPSLPGDHALSLKMARILPMPNKENRRIFPTKMYDRLPFFLILVQKAIPGMERALKPKSEETVFDLSDLNTIR